MFDREDVEAAYARLWTRGIEVSCIEVKEDGVCIRTATLPPVRAVTLDAAVDYILKARKKPASRALTST
jgi:hypothetical protein